MQRNLARFSAVARSLLGEQVGRIVEVGARDCRETLGFAALYPQARIYAFECNPDTLPLCRSAVEGHSGITLVEKAAAERPGRVKFYPVDPSANPGASSLLKASGRYALEDYRQREIEVEAVTLESFLEAEAIPRVDLLWMDIQVEFEEIYANQPLFPEVRAFLEDRGFRFFGFTVYARHRLKRRLLQRSKRSSAR